MGLKHEDGPVCSLCNAKLVQAHSVLRDFFNALKKSEGSVHISWAWRNEEMQNKFFEEGKSRVKWPNSKHNSTTADGRPCSRAIDLFQIDADGLARFSGPFYEKIANFAHLEKFPIVWGGSWAQFKDRPHFQLSESVPQPVVKNSTPV